MKYCKRIFGRHLGYLYDGRTERIEVSGADIEVLPNLPMCRVPVSSSCATVPVCSVGHRSRCRTDTGTPGMVVEAVWVHGVYLSERTATSVSVGQRYRGRTEPYELSIAVIETKHAYRCFGCQYKQNAEFSQVSANGIDTVPHQHPCRRYCSSGYTGTRRKYWRGRTKLYRSVG